jgi:hypothetical protein
VGYTNWQDFYNHIHTYHRQDFPNLPDYSNFVRAIDLFGDSYICKNRGNNL